MIAMALRGGAKLKIGEVRFGKCRLTITPPEFLKVCKRRIFRKKILAGEDPLDPVFTEFDGAMKTRPFFVIMKSSKNSYEHFYVNGKLPEQLSSVMSCDMFCIFL
jgi:hypothetical protein